MCFLWWFHVLFFAFLCFLLGKLFKIVPKQSVEVLSTVPNYRSYWRALLKIYVLDKLRLGVSDSAIDCEFNVNESTVWAKWVSLTKTLIKQGHVNRLWQGLQESNPVFLPAVMIQYLLTIWNIITVDNENQMFIFFLE